MTTALTIIAAHMVGEYVTQTDWMAANKLSDWRARLAHVSAYTAGFVIVPFQAHMDLRIGIAFLITVGVPHFIVDCRRWASGNVWPPKPILVDQSIHAVCLAATAAGFSLA